MYYARVNFFDHIFRKCVFERNLLFYESWDIGWAARLKTSAFSGFNGAPGKIRNKKQSPTKRNLRINTADKDNQYTEESEVLSQVVVGEKSRCIRLIVSGILG